MEHMTILPTHMLSVFNASRYAEAEAAVGYMSHRMQDTRRSILIIGDDGGTHWTDIARNAEARYLGQVTHAAARARLLMTAHVDTVVLDCRDATADLAPIGAALADLAQHGTTNIVVSTSIDRLDRDLAALDLFPWTDAPVYWLCDAAAEEQAEAVATALGQARVSTTLHDSGQSSQNNQLEQLSLEVQRLSRTLEEMRFPNRTPDHEARAGRSTPVEDSDAARGGKKRGESWRGSAVRGSLFASGEGTLTAAAVRDLIRARRIREQFFDGDLFADPAWDMILDLMAARLSGERVSVSSLCIAAAVPPTTALRWIRHLTQAGIFERRPDTQDGRRVFIALSDKTAAAVHRWYAMSVPLRCEDED